MKLFSIYVKRNKSVEDYTKLIHENQISNDSGKNE